MFQNMMTMLIIIRAAIFAQILPFSAVQFVKFRGTVIHKYPV